MSATPFEEGLAFLRAHYAERIEAALVAGRMDLVRELADGYEDEALELMISVEGGTAPVRARSQEPRRYRSLDDRRDDRHVSRVPAGRQHARPATGRRR